MGSSMIHHDLRGFSLVWCYCSGPIRFDFLAARVPAAEQQSGHVLRTIALSGRAMERGGARVAGIFLELARYP